VAIKDLDLSRLAAVQIAEAQLDGGVVADGDIGGVLLEEDL